MMQAMEAGLVTLFGDAQLAAIVGDRVHRGLAPEEESHPLLVFGVRTNHQPTCGDDDTGYYEVTVTVKAIDLGDDQTQADAAFSRADALVVSGAITVAGHTVLGVTRGVSFSYPERVKDRNYQHVGGEFNVLVQRT